MKKLFIFSLSLLLSLILVETAALAAGQWQQQTLNGMSYWLYTPDASAPTPHGLMLNLHGCSQHAADLKAQGNWEPAADQYGMVVAIPDVPNGGVVLGCWDYYGTDQNENNRDNAPLLALVQKLQGDSSLQLDIRKTFVSGLSSGATQAMLLGCLRPDIFAGVGMNSGPVVGSAESEISSPQTTAAQAASFCQQLAGTHASFFSTQMASTINGDQDYVVSQQHSVLSEQFLSSIYEAPTKTVIAMSTLPGPNTKGHGEVLSDAAGKSRISYLVNSGLGHDWFAGSGTASPSPTPNPGPLPNPNPLPGGPGLGGNYISADSIEYPLYLTRFFMENSGRF